MYICIYKQIYMCVCIYKYNNIYIHKHTCYTSVNTLFYPVTNQNLFFFFFAGQNTVVDIKKKKHLFDIINKKERVLSAFEQE